MRKLNERYENDPVFSQLVDTMYTLIRQLRTTPMEIREAAMVAQIKWEIENPSLFPNANEAQKQFLQYIKYEEYTLNENKEKK